MTTSDRDEGASMGPARDDYWIRGLSRLPERDTPEVRALLASLLEDVSSLMQMELRDTRPAVTFSTWDER